MVGVGFVWSTKGNEFSWFLVQKDCYLVILFDSSVRGVHDPSNQRRAPSSCSIPCFLFLYVHCMACTAAIIS
jgi:hypothetical protein